MQTNDILIRAKAIILQIRHNISATDTLAFFTMVTALPLLIALLQLFLLIYIIPAEIPPNYIILSLESPTLTAMFMSSYFHNITDPDHLFSNYFNTIFMMAVIWLIWFVVMPLKGFDRPKHFLMINIGAFLLILPFFVSIVSLYFCRIFEKTYTLGFSGIVYALFGLFIYLILMMFYETAIDSGLDTVYMVHLLLLSAGLLIIIPVFAILSEIGDSINVFGHLAGFSFGIIFPSITGIKLTKKCRNM